MMLPLDHIGILGSDITEMVNAYRSLGFHVTEPERLNAGAGGDFGRQYSAHVMFENTYIELTAVEDCQSEHHLAPYMRCLLYTSPSPRDLSTSRMPSSA